MFGVHDPQNPANVWLAFVPKLLQVWYKFEHPKYIKNPQVRKGTFPTQPKQVLRVILLDPRAEQILITSTK